MSETALTVEKTSKRCATLFDFAQAENLVSRRPGGDAPSAMAAGGTCTTGVVWREFPVRPKTAVAGQPRPLCRQPRRWWTRPNPRQWPQAFAYYATHTLNPAVTGGKHWFE